MGYIRKKVAGNTTSTFNTKTGQTRYTTSNKVGNITNSSSHKGNSTRTTKTTTVNHVVTRTSKSYTPPKMKTPTPPKTQYKDYSKSAKGSHSSSGECGSVSWKWVVGFIVFFIILGVLR